MNRKLIKRIGIIICTILTMVAVGILVCDGIVVRNATGRTFDNIKDVPEREYGLLLATSPITPWGGHNFYFDNRIKSSVELSNAGKVKRIIASGGDYTGQHNGNGCDEPKAILDSMVAKGVPAETIILDYDGQRTIKSIINAKKCFGLDSLTLISQKYHNE